MMYTDDYLELVDILMDSLVEEESGHVSFIGNDEEITKALLAITATTDAVPDTIDFNNTLDNYYSISIDLWEDELTYSILPAVDESDNFYSGFGFCLVSTSVPKKFEEDYSNYDDGIGYESPVRISIGTEGEDESDCDGCDDINCPNHKDYYEAREIATKVDTNDNGKVEGFIKSWSNGNTRATYSFYSTNEDEVLSKMKDFDIE